MKQFPTSLRALLIVGVVTCAACDKSQDNAPATPANSTTSEKPQEAPLAPTEGAFSVSAFKVSGSQGAYQIEEAPKPESLEPKVIAALLKQDNFEKDGPRALEGGITYDVRTLSDGGYDVMLIGGLSSPNAKFDAAVNYKTSQEEWKGKSLDAVVDTAIDDFASRIASQAAVLGADVPGLVAVLQSEDEKVDARLLAIQELRERGSKDQVSAIRPYLDKEEPPELRVAASAALVRLGDSDSNAQILQVAEDLSRDRNPQYVPMLHILSDIGGTEVETYLQAVAEGHAAPAVRTVAEEALKNARAKSERQP